MVVLDWTFRILLFFLSTCPAGTFMLCEVCSKHIDLGGMFPGEQGSRISVFSFLESKAPQILDFNKDLYLMSSLLQLVSTVGSFVMNECADPLSLMNWEASICLVAVWTAKVGVNKLLGNQSQL